MQDPAWDDGDYPQGRRAARRAGYRPHDGAHHLPLGRRDGPQVRSAQAGVGRRRVLHLRRPVRGRELSAAPGRRASSTGSTRTPTSTSRGRSTSSTRHGPTARSSRRSPPSRPSRWSSGSRATGSSRPSRTGRSRSHSCARASAPAMRSSRPTWATTRSSSRARTSTRSSGGSSSAPRFTTSTSPSERPPR